MGGPHSARQRSCSLHNETIKRESHILKEFNYCLRVIRLMSSFSGDLLLPQTARTRMFVLRVDKLGWRTSP